MLLPYCPGWYFNCFRYLVLFSSWNISSQYILGCQTLDLYGKHVNQLNVQWNKAVQRTLNLPYKTHRRLLPLIVNGKSFKSQHCSRFHKYVNGFFSSENIYVSFIGAKAKTRVTGSLGRNWARLTVMDGLVPFDPSDEHTSAHAGIIKELLGELLGGDINECLHLSRTEIDDLIYHLCCEWYVIFVVCFFIVNNTASWDLLSHNVCMVYW